MHRYISIYIYIHIYIYGHGAPVVDFGAVWFGVQSVSGLIGVVLDFGVSRLTFSEQVEAFDFKIAGCPVKRNVRGIPMLFSQG